MDDRSAYLDDELSLKDILNILKPYARGIILAPIVTSLAALLVTFLFVQPCYKAYGTIQIGQVNGKALENVFVLQERMKDMSFISEIIATHRDLFKYEKNLAAEEARLGKALEVKKNKDTDLVSFTLLAHSQERAKLKAAALIDTLKLKHGELYNPNLQMIHNQIDIVAKQIESISQDNQKFRLQLQGSHNLNSYNAVVDSLVVNSQSDRLRDLTNKKLELEASLNSALTFNTKLLGEIYVSKTPVSPNLPLIAAITFLVTLFGVVFAVFARHALKD